MSPAKPKKRPAPRGKKPSRPTQPAHRRPSAKGGKARPARKKARVAQAPRKVAENPRALALARKMAALALDKKASDVVILDVRGMTSYADYFVVASGDSERQVTAIADHIEQVLRETENARPIGTEGQQTGHWVLLDYGEVVAHLFFNDVRAFYDLEGLWADAPKEQVREIAGATA